MKKKIVSSLLILCTILFQGNASLSNYSSTDSLDLLLRKKRVIDRTPHANSKARIQDVPYVVNILENGNHVCAGSILSAVVILTAANCIENLGRYTVISGTVHTNRGISHEVVGVLRHPSATAFSFVHNIALLSIAPPIRIARNLNQPIAIYNVNNGHLPPNVFVTTSGWGLAIANSHGLGCMAPGAVRRQVFPGELRSITLRTLNTRDCRIHHGNDATITEHVVCTYHEDKFCAPGDNGNPLAFNNQLVGVMAWDGGHGGPEVFVNVAHPDYKTWIYTHMHNIPHYRPMVAAQPSPPRNGNSRTLRRCSRIQPCN